MKSPDNDNETRKNTLKKHVAYLKKKLTVEHQYLNMIKSNFADNIQKILSDSV